MITEGTANKTPEELEEAIDMLGARYQRLRGESNAFQDQCQYSCRNFESTVALVEEILLEPRWDEEQFELAKSRIINMH